MGMFPGEFLRRDGGFPLTDDWETGEHSIIGSDHWYLRADSKKLYFGAEDDYSIEWDGSYAVHTVSSGTVRYDTHIDIGSHKLGKFLSVPNSYIHFSSSVDNPIAIGKYGFLCWTSGSKSYDASISDGLIVTDYSEDIVAIEGDVKITSDSKKLYFGAEDDAYIAFDSDSLNIVANNTTAGDDLELTCGDLKINGSTGWSGTFTNGDSDTVTVTNGLITNVA